MYLGLDLGTSGLKGLLIDHNQKIIAEAAVPLNVSRPKDAWSEQDANDWIDAASKIFDQISKEADFSKLLGIGLSGQMHGAVCLDKNDNILRPVILWNDTRSHLEAAAMDADPEFRSISGNIVFPGFTAPKLAWLQKNEPELFDNIAKILLPKDYLRLWLTGEYVAEMSDAAGTSWLDTGKRDWSDKLLTKTNLTRDQMPTLIEGSETSATIRPELAKKYGFPSDLIVAGGAGDNAASAVGVGVVNAGDAFLSLGTSGVLFAACDGYSPDPATAVHTFCHALPNTWHQMGVILSASDSLNWYSKLVGQKAADLTADLGALKAPSRTLFLPYLGGERTPHNDASARGAFLGLDHVTDTEAGTRCVLEGISFAFRDNYDALYATGTKINTITAVGGGSKSDYWLKILATVLDMPIDVPAAGDFGGAFGAARLAIMAKTGAKAEIASRPEFSKTIMPEKDLTQAYADTHARYQEAYKATKHLV